MTALAWAFDAPPSAEPYPQMDVIVRQPEVQVWLETMTGQRLNMLRGAAVGSCEWRRNDVGQATVTVPLSDPGIGPLIVGGELTTWLDTDIEVAVYRQGACVWRGPVVRCSHRNGVATVEAWSQEAYLSKQKIGGPERVNYLPGYWDDPDSVAAVDPEPGVTVSEVEAPESSLWRRDTSLAIEATSVGQGATVHGDLPVGTIKNYADVTIRLKLEDGAVLPFLPDRAEEKRAARVVHYATDPGSVSGPAAYEEQATYILGIRDYVSGWATATQRVPQLPNRRNRYYVTFYGGVGGAAISGEAELTRDENVSALAGTDVATLMAALYQHLIRLMGADRFARRVEEVGVELVDDVRHLASDHDDVSGVLGNWTADGDWWVEQSGGQVVFCWGPRGRDVPLWYSDESLADLQGQWDATDGVNELIAAAPGNDGPTREEYSATTDGPTRIPGRAQMPGGLSMRDLVGWADREVERQGTEQQVDAVPVVGWSGDILSMVRVADRVPIRVVDGPLDYEYTATVESLQWDPYTDRVVPGWRRRTDA